MDQGLTYQKARRIRGTKVTDLLADQLLYEKSIGKAIGKTISLKTQSKIKGIKEKFDPLNVAKFLTGGSKLAPALLGRMLGRDIRDIEYFTGRNRPLRVGRGTASRITPLPSESGDIQGINEQLLKIYSFLKTSNEQDVKRKEKEQNFAEEKQIESERRHKEFIEALKNLTGKKTATVVKKEDATGGSLLPDWLSDLKDAFDLLGGKNALKTLGSFLLNPVGFVIAGGGLLSYIAANIAQNEDFQKAFTGKDKEMLGAMAGDAALATNILAASAKGGREKKLVDDANALKNKLTEDAGFFVKASGGRKYLIEKKGLTPEEANFLMPGNQNGPDAEEKYGKIEEREKLLEIIKQKTSVGPKPAAEGTATPVSSTPEAAPAASATPVSTTGGSGDSVATTQTTQAAAPETPKMEVVPTPKGSQLNTVMTENIQANLPSAPKPVEAQTTNNVSVANKTKSESFRLSEIPVRNIEPTFMQMIVGSTRVV